MSKEDFWFGILLGFTAGLLLTGIYDYSATDKWRTDAIEHGCAAYDQQTGEWHWIKGGDAE